MDLPLFSFAFMNYEGQSFPRCNAEMLAWQRRYFVNMKMAITGH